MKKKALFCISLLGLLVACGGNSSSSSSASSSSSSTSISSSSVATYPRMNFVGDFTIDFRLMKEKTLADVHIDLSGVRLAIKTDTEMERIGDALDYTYYKVSNLIGVLNADAVTLTVKRGRATLSYDFATTAVDFYLLAGDFYVDLSGLAITDGVSSSEASSGLDLPSGKILIRDAVSFLNEEKYRTLADVLSLDAFGMETLMSLAQTDETIGSALTMERYSDEEFLVKYALTSDSLAALVGQFSEEGAQDVKTKIDEAIDIAEGTYFSALYNVRTKEIANVGLNGGISPIIAPESEEKQPLIQDFVLRADAKLFGDASEEFVIPPLEGYEEYTLPEQSE